MERGYVCLEMHGRFYAKCGTAIASILIAFILVSRDKNQSKIKASTKIKASSKKSTGFLSPVSWG